jgi:hypothetical protein
MSDEIPPLLTPAARSGEGEDWLKVVERQVEALRFGSVEITVHEGRVVQIETSVKVRFDRPQKGAS